MDSVFKHMDSVFKLYGLPHSIFIDRDPLFPSNFWLEFYKLQDVALRHSTTCYPQSDGQYEVLNKMFGNIFAMCYC